MNDISLDDLRDLQKPLSEAGLFVFDEPREGHYWCTPVGAYTFGSTGGGGTRFSILGMDDRESESLVLITRPSMHPLSFVAGEGLLGFMCLGARCGYFVLQFIDSKNFDPYECRYESIMQDVGKNEDQMKWEANAQREQRALDLVVEQLGLKPWAEFPRRFKHLNEKYKNFIVTSENQW